MSATRNRRALCEDRRILLKILYWLAVVAVSLALVIGLILWFESQDASEIRDGAGGRTLTASS